MIVYDLACDMGHRFEGWFSSSVDYADQREDGLLACPQCGSQAIGKAPMAPAVAKKGSQTATPKREADSPAADEGATEAVAGGALPQEVAKALEAVATKQAKALEKSEYVGDQFAKESRAIHYGERDAAIIHGKATDKERRDLLEEGIAVSPLLVPFTPPDEVN